MAGVTVKKEIAAPPERVFEAATDFANAAKSIRGIEKVEMLTDGPVGVGTRFRETRIMFKREATEVMEVTDFDPPRGYSLRAESHGCRYLSRFRFEPKDGGTELEMRFEATPLTFVAKVMAFLMKPMVGMVAKECGKDMEDLKTRIESMDTASSASA